MGDPQTLGKAIGELKDKMGAAGVAGKTRLTDMEMAQVAIAYNRGSFNPAKRLKQGHKDDAGRFYGENFADFLKQSKAVVVTLPAGGGTGSGKTFKVATQGGPLLLRSAPRKRPANVIGRLDNGQRVNAVSGTPDNGFLEVDALAEGKTVRGFASAAFLQAS